MRGIKAASYGSVIYTLMWNELGANSSPLGITEWAPAFQSGAVDAVGTPATFYVPSGLNKIAPVLSRVQLWSSPAMTVMNKAIFDKLPKEQQEALIRASTRETTAEVRKESRAFEGMIRGLHEKGGGKIVELTPAQRDEWRKVMVPAWPKMVKAVGGDSENFYKQLEAARKSCEAKS